MFALHDDEGKHLLALLSFWLLHVKYTVRCAYMCINSLGKLLLWLPWLNRHFRDGQNCSPLVRSHALSEWRSTLESSLDPVSGCVNLEF
jgi:hypothetical protein